MNDLQARALSLEELAERYRYSDDPGISRIARAVIEGLAGRDDEMQELSDDNDHLHSQLETSRAEAACFRDLLEECLDEDIDADLSRRIQKAL